MNRRWDYLIGFGCWDKNNFRWEGQNWNLRIQNSSNWLWKESKSSKYKFENWFEKTRLEDQFLLSIFFSTYFVSHSFFLNFSINLATNSFFFFHVAIENQGECNTTQYTDDRSQGEHQSDHNTSEVDSTYDVKNNWKQKNNLLELCTLRIQQKWKFTHQKREYLLNLSSNTTVRRGTSTQACANRRKMKTTW